VIARVSAAAIFLVLGVHGQSDATEVTITFDSVQVSGIETDTLSNRVLHLRESEASEPAPPAEEPATQGAATTPQGTAKPPQGAPQSSQGTPTSPQGKQESPQRKPESPQATPKGLEPLRKPLSGRAIPAPGAGLFNPSFIEQGFLVESFWAVNTGDANGYFVRGHFHPKNLETGFEAQHFGGPRELHGLFIRAVDGRPFSVKSLAYRVTRNRELGRSQSVVGFSNHDVKVLIARDFTPKLSVLGQFIQFGVGPPISNDTALPFQTLPIDGFGYVTQVFIASSASVDLDSIVLEIEE